ncbi:MAG: AAA family ATPase [Lentisphaeria bacterium]|nr:AAA family ATPase [Lentisphaeria bacterium]
MFVGANGVGKSSLLDGVTILLSRFAGRIRSLRSNGRTLSNLDIRIGGSQAKIELQASVLGSELRWYVVRGGQRKGQRINGLTDLREFVRTIHERLEERADFSLPLMVHYPVNRAVLDIPLRIRKKHSFEQSAAYDNALTGAANNFRVFFEWFRGREDIENERWRREPGYTDRELQAVRQAIGSLMSGYSDFRVQRNPLRMTLSKKGQELRVDHLSDGEKGLLTMVGDIARRLAIANPGSGDPLAGTGVVLIDEVDLHLHPAWQRTLIPRIEKTFPNLQFLVTTHSPAVLGHVAGDNVVVLQPGDKGTVKATRLSTYGKDANRILEDVLDTPARPDDAREAYDKIYEMITENELDGAEAALTRLATEIKGDPETTRARALIRRKRWVGR